MKKAIGAIKSIGYHYDDREANNNNCRVSRIIGYNTDPETPITEVAILRSEQPMSIQYVSLLNTPFSGSTLVSMLLCSQPRIIGFGDTYVVPDPRHYPKHPCTCGRWYDECPPRVILKNAIRSGGLSDYDWDRASAGPVPRRLPWKLRQSWPLGKSSSLPFHRGTPHALRKKLYRRFYLENTLMLQGLEDTGDYDIYFDGCKGLVRTELLRSMIPNIKLLHLVRHPGAYFYHFHKAGESQFEKRLSHWARYNRHAHDFARLVPDGNYMAVTYESIVQQPERFIDEMEKFMGMTETHSSDRTRIRRSQVHIIGNRMRETADRVLDYSNTWRGKMPAPVEEMADEAIRKDEWLRSLYESTQSPI